MRYMPNILLVCQLRRALGLTWKSMILQIVSVVKKNPLYDDSDCLSKPLNVASPH